MTEQPIVPMNDLGRLIAADRGLIDAAIAEVLDSGWLVHGRQHEAFEREFAAYLGAPHSIGVANGTDAIRIALEAAGVGNGDVVLSAANAGFYTATACLALGARIRFVDVDPLTLNIAEDHLLRALRLAPRAVVVTHLYGGLADVDTAIGVCRDEGITVIEDCAQAAGARYADGAAAGTRGTAGCFSFYPTKNLGAIGDGGAISTADDGFAQRCREIRQYGWSERYSVVRRGSNSRLDEIQAAVLRRRLNALDERNLRRRRIASAYAEALDPAAGRLVFRDDPSHVAHLAVVRSPHRAALREHLLEHGVASDVHYPIPDDQQAVWAAIDVPVDADELAETHRAAQEILSIPCFPELRDDEIERVERALRSFDPEAHDAP